MTWGRCQSAGHSAQVIEMEGKKNCVAWGLAYRKFSSVVRSLPLWSSCVYRSHRRVVHDVELFRCCPPACARTAAPGRDCFKKQQIQKPFTAKLETLPTEFKLRLATRCQEAHNILGRISKWTSPLVNDIYQSPTTSGYSVPGRVRCAIELR